MTTWPFSWDWWAVPTLLKSFEGNLVGWALPTNSLVIARWASSRLGTTRQMS
jgi:hypothetical protein